MEEIKTGTEISAYEIVQERGHYTANGFTFEILPVYFEEEFDYYSDNPLSMLLQKQQEDIDDKNLSQYIIALFQVKSKDDVLASLGLFGRMKLKLVKLFSKNYHYYSDNPSAVGFVKWIEKKVKYKGKKIRFYDLERKYGLTKLEIAKMYRYMEELSRGF